MNVVYDLKIFSTIIWSAEAKERQK